MKRIAAAVGLALLFTVTAAAPALANNPPGPPGPPSQSCQSVEPFTPGHAANSPGSPFNEPGINSANGGTGGQHYSARSQYDVACYQQSVHRG